MTISRDVIWEGFFNARDLGGLPTRSRGTIRFNVEGYLAAAGISSTEIALVRHGLGAAPRAVRRVNDERKSRNE